MQSEFLSQPKGSQSGFKTSIFTLRENIQATHVVKLENWTLYLITIWEALPWDILRINSLNLNPLLIPAKYLSNLPKYSAPWEIFIACYNIKGVEFLDSLEWNRSISSSFFVANLISQTWKKKFINYSIEISWTKQNEDKSCKLFFFRSGSLTEIRCISLPSNPPTIGDISLVIRWPARSRSQFRVEVIRTEKRVRPD